MFKNSFVFLCFILGMTSPSTAKVFAADDTISGQITVIGEGAPFSINYGDTDFTIWHDNKLNWHDAYEFCINQNMSLIVLDSREKVIELQMFLVKHNFVQAGINDANKPYIYWIGGNDLKRRNNWMWIPINEEFTYTHWLEGEPTRTDQQRCVEMGGKSLGRWSNSPCSLKRYFICERRARRIRRANEL